MTSSKLLSLPKRFVLAVALIPLVAPAAPANPKPGVPPSAPKAVNALIKTFSGIDWDGNGFLTLGEYSATLRVMKGAADRIFHALDGNQDGAISIEEFAKSRWVRLPAGTEPPVDPVKQQFRQFDVNHDGVVSQEEIGTGQIFTSADALGRFFAAADRDGSGTVDLTEWRAGQPVVR
jgi:Ca2+-binding EF-hand superfamily protein